MLRQPDFSAGAAVARRGLPAGAASRAFSLADAARALLRRPHVVYVELDAAARLAGDAALLAVRARLAPHPPARTAALLLAPPAAAAPAPAPARSAAWRLRVCVLAALAPHDELLLWPEDALLALAAVPVLAPTNIRGDAEYRCHRCGARFSQPNPLKMHLYLSCGAPDPAAFWRRLLENLAAAPAPAVVPPPTGSAPALAGNVSAVGPAALEALAAAWGARGPAGHACIYCGKLYSRKYGLKIHIRTHTGYKPLRCGHCARRFGDPSNLNKHVRLHAAAGGAAGGGAGARHACAQCGAVLARRRDLLRHERARHHAPPPRALQPA